MVFKIFKKKYMIWLPCYTLVDYRYLIAKVFVCDFEKGSKHIYNIAGLLNPGGSRNVFKCLLDHGLFQSHLVRILVDQLSEEPGTKLRSQYKNNQ